MTNLSGAMEKSVSFDNDYLAYLEMSRESLGNHLWDIQRLQSPSADKVRMRMIERIGEIQKLINFIEYQPGGRRNRE